MFALPVGVGKSSLLIVLAALAVPLALVVLAATLLLLIGAAAGSAESRKYSIDAVNALAGLMGSVTGRPSTPPSRPPGPD